MKATVLRLLTAAVALATVVAPLARGGSARAVPDAPSCCCDHSTPGACPCGCDADSGAAPAGAGACPGPACPCVAYVPAAPSAGTLPELLRAPPPPHDLLTVLHDGAGTACSRTDAPPTPPPIAAR